MTTEDRRGDVPRSVYLFLAAGLVAASQSGNIIRIGTAHPVAIAAWRLGLACLLLAPLAGRHLAQLAQLSRREWILLLTAGLALAIHFTTWIAAVQHTTVANAALFFSINPVLTATAAHFLFGERLGWKLFVSIGLGLAGVAAIGINDLDLSTGNLAGDGLALLCSALFTVYFLLGKRLRQQLDNRVYVTAVYGVAAVVSFACLLALNLPVVDYDRQTWLCFLLMALIPTMIGHTALNFSLRYIDVSRISVVTLTEPALASVVAWYAWNESLSLGGAVGYALIGASVVALVWDR